MIRLEEGVDRHLPVDARPERPGLEVVPPLEPEARELGGEPAQVGVDVDRRLGLGGCGPHPDEPVLLDHRKRPQGVLLAGELRKALLAGDVDQAAVEAVSPPVVGTGERALPAPAAIDHPRPAVTADVGERPERAGRGADQEDRHARVVVGQVVAGGGDPAGEPDQERVLAEEDALLERQPLLRRVGRDRVREHRLRHRGRAGVEVVAEAARQLRAGLRPHRAPARGGGPRDRCAARPGSGRTRTFRRAWWPPVGADPARRRRRLPRAACDAKRRVWNQADGSA